MNVQNCISISDKVKNKKCKFYDTGVCLKKNNCKYQHPGEICVESNCSKNQLCPKRHPKICLYYHFNQQCKFRDSCLFKHKTNNQGEENDILRKELEALKKEKESVQVTFAEKERHFSKQLEIMKMQMNQLQSKLKDKEILQNDNISLKVTLADKSHFFDTSLKNMNMKIKNYRFGSSAANKRLSNQIKC